MQNAMNIRKASILSIIVFLIGGVLLVISKLGATRQYIYSTTVAVNSGSDELTEQRNYIEVTDSNTIQQGFISPDPYIYEINILFHTYSENEPADIHVALMTTDQVIKEWNTTIQYEPFDVWQSFKLDDPFEMRLDEQQLYITITSPYSLSGENCASITTVSATEIAGDLIIDGVSSSDDLAYSVVSISKQAADNKIFDKLVLEGCLFFEAIIILSFVRKSEK